MKMSMKFILHAWVIYRHFSMPPGRKKMTAISQALIYLIFLDVFKSLKSLNDTVPDRLLLVCKIVCWFKFIPEDSDDKKVNIGGYKYLTSNQWWQTMISLFILAGCGCPKRSILNIFQIVTQIRWCCYDHKTRIGLMPLLTFNSGLFGAIRI